MSTDNFVAKVAEYDEKLRDQAQMVHEFWTILSRTNNAEFFPRRIGKFFSIYNCCILETANLF